QFDGLAGVPALLVDDPRADLERHPDAPVIADAVADGRWHVDDLVRGQTLAPHGRANQRAERVVGVQDALRLAGRPRREREQADVVRVALAARPARCVEQLRPRDRPLWTR